MFSSTVISDGRETQDEYGPEKDFGPRFVVDINEERCESVPQRVVGWRLPAICSWWGLCPIAEDYHCHIFFEVERRKGAEE